MRLLLVASLALLPSIGTQAAEETRAAHRPGRLGVHLGPRYFLQTEDQVQFSFGVEGRYLLLGPLSVGLSLAVGVIDDIQTDAAAALRVHLLRVGLLSLAADVRGGAVLYGSGGRSHSPLFMGGFELVHDLGERYDILVRAQLGFLPGEEQSVLMDLVVGLGLRL
jgi:hypothetical protein